jgi:hypothetical protein
MDKRVKTDSYLSRWNKQEHMQQHDWIRLHFLVKNLSGKVKRADLNKNDTPNLRFKNLWAWHVCDWWKYLHVITLTACKIIFHSQSSTSAYLGKRTDKRIEKHSQFEVTSKFNFCFCLCCLNNTLSQPLCSSILYLKQDCFFCTQIVPTGYVGYNTHSFSHTLQNHAHIHTQFLKIKNVCLTH